MSARAAKKKPERNAKARYRSPDIPETSGTRDICSQMHPRRSKHTLCRCEFNVTSHLNSQGATIRYITECSARAHPPMPMQTRRRGARPSRHHVIAHGPNTKQKCTSGAQDRHRPNCTVQRGTGKRARRVARSTPVCQYMRATTNLSMCRRWHWLLRPLLGDEADELEYHLADLRPDAVGGLLQPNFFRDTSCHKSSTCVSWCASTEQGKVSKGHECSEFELHERARVPRACSDGCGARRSGRALESEKIYGGLR